MYQIVSGYTHTIPDEFVSATLFIRIPRPSTLVRSKPEQFFWKIVSVSTGQVWIRINKVADTNLSGIVWISPETYFLFQNYVTKHVLPIFPNIP